MRVRETQLKGAYLIDIEPREDDRGFFARLYCRDEFAQKGLRSEFVQINTAFSLKRGTLRGMHYQLPPASEIKVVRCLRGSIVDAIVDLRPQSPTFLQSFSAELTDENRTMLYVPEGFAHGYLTTSDNAEVLYLVSAFYAPELERGLRYNDPALRIDWPLVPAIISAKDMSHPNFSPEYHINNDLRNLPL